MTTKINVSRTETCITRVWYFDVEVPDDYKEMDSVDFDDYVTDKVIEGVADDEEIIVVIDTGAWKADEK
jgi:hypothetical protein